MNSVNEKKTSMSNPTEKENSMRSNMRTSAIGATSIQDCSSACEDTIGATVTALKATINEAVANLCLKTGGVYSVLVDELVADIEVCAQRDTYVDELAQFLYLPDVNEDTDEYDHTHDINLERFAVACRSRRLTVGALEAIEAGIKACRLAFAARDAVGEVCRAVVAANLDQPLGTFTWADVDQMLRERGSSLAELVAEMGLNDAEDGK